MDIGKIIKKANRLAQQNKKTELEALEDSVIQTGDAGCVHLFATYVKGANITKLEDAIIQIEDAFHIYLFAREIKGVDIARLWRAMQTTNDQNWIDMFKSNILSKHPEVLEEEYPHVRDTDVEPLEFIDLD